MKTFIDQQEKQLRRQYHSLAGQLGMSDEQRKNMLYDNFRVESSVDLDAHQLIDLVHTLEKRLGDETQDWRRRAIASIGGWLRMAGIEKADPVENITYIKQIACRAAQCQRFNAIPVARLRNLYYEFRNKQTDKEQVARVMDEELNRLLAAQQAMSGVIAEA
jgi:hypothetical protein